MKDKNLGKVSIIVPAYNTEQYIRKCIDSLVYQTYKNIEIILVDDGSSDATEAICEEYQQRYQEIIRVMHIEHSGVTNARLLGVRKATGEYLAFVDADDWIEQDYIKSMILHMGEADVIAAGILREQMDDNENVFCEFNGLSAGIYVSECEKRKLYEKMLYCEGPYRFGVLPYLCNKLFRKILFQPFLENVDKQIFDGEDVAIVYPYLLAAQKIVLIDECKYHYRIHKDSTSLKDLENAYWNATCLYQELYICFKKSRYCESLTEQLDYYMRRIIWKKDPAAYLDVNSFLFPFSKVRLGSGIILYGMGKMGVAFYQQLIRSQYCQLIAWADRSPEQLANRMGSISRIFPQEITEYQFDYIVIAIQNRMIAVKIMKELSAMGISEQKIVRM